MFSTNSIVHGDCTRILRRLPNACVDLVVTDPPYGVNYRDRLNRSIANDDRPERFLGVFNDVYRVLKPNTLCVCFYGWNRVDAFFRAWRQAGFVPVGHIVWQKNYASSRSFLQARHEQSYLLAKGRPAKPASPLNDVQPWEYSGNRIHPTEKSVGILRPLIESFSRPGEFVLDPFAGSGSTCVAAALSGRRFMGVELDADYHRLAVARLAELAQRQPSAPRDMVSTLNAFTSWAQTRGFTLPKDVLASALRRSLSTQVTIKSPRH